MRTRTHTPRITSRITVHTLLSWGVQIRDLVSTGTRVMNSNVCLCIINVQCLMFKNNLLANQKPVFFDIARILRSTRSCLFLFQTFRIQPPMCITKDDGDFFLAVFDQALHNYTKRRWRRSSAAPGLTDWSVPNQPWIHFSLLLQRTNHHSARLCFKSDGKHGLQTGSRSLG